MADEDSERRAELTQAHPRRISEFMTASWEELTDDEVRVHFIALIKAAHRRFGESDVLALLRVAARHIEGLPDPRPAAGALAASRPPKLPLPSDVRLGPTGRFPRGKLSADDQGELCMAIGVRQDRVVVEFGVAVRSLSLPPDLALDLARILTRRADDALERVGEDAEQGEAS